LSSNKINSSIEEIQKQLELSQQQVLSYSRDFAVIYRQERLRRKNLEKIHQKLRTVINSISDAMVATNTNLTIQEYNSAFKNIFPSIRNSKKNPSLKKLLPGNLVRENIAKMKRERRSFINFEFVKEDKEDSIWEVTLSTILQGNTIEGFIFLFRDITETKKFEKLKNNICNFATQEIQGPLNGLLGLINSLYGNIKDRLSEEELSYFNFLLRSGKNLQKIIEEMMQINPSQNGDELNKSLVQLEGVVVKALESLESDIENQEVHVQFEVRDKGAILIDQDLMFKAICSIQKILRAHTKTNGKIEIEMRQFNENLLLQFFCPDISRIDWNDLKKLLYSKNGFSEGIESTGVGLALAREIVEWNGGKINMKNRKNRNLDIVFPSWNEIVGI